MPLLVLDCSSQTLQGLPFQPEFSLPAVRCEMPLESCFHPLAGAGKLFLRHQPRFPSFQNALSENLYIPSQGLQDYLLQAVGLTFKNLINLKKVLFRATLSLKL